jgi:hypothetical protein
MICSGQLTTGSGDSKMTRFGPTQLSVLFATRNGGEPLIWPTVHAPVVRLFVSTGSPMWIFSARTLSVGTKKPSGWRHAAQNLSGNDIFLFPALLTEPVHREWRCSEPFEFPEKRAPQHGDVSRWELSMYGSGENCDGAAAKGGAGHGVSLMAVDELSD